MKTRIKIDEAEPAGYKAILGLEKFIESTSLTRIDKDLIKIRDQIIPISNTYKKRFFALINHPAKS